jgi:hypothetical protein
MKTTTTIILLFCIQILKAQFDYILTNTNDTIKVDIKYWTDTKLVCTKDSGEIKFKAKDIIGFNVDGVFKESARVCPTLIGFKKYMFLTRLLYGKMNIYCISVTDRFTDRNKNGSVTLVTKSYVTGTVAYARKANTLNYRKLFGYNKIAKMMDNCILYNKQFPDGVKNVDYPYFEAVEFYNNNCK